MTPAAIAATLAAFVDVLLPGDDLFPSASVVGTQTMLAERIRQRLGADAVADVAARLSTSGSFADADAQARAEIVRGLERDDPALFTLLYSATTFSYYQHPIVTAAIRALGHDYKDSPQPEGYAMPAFDPTPGVNLPLKPKGTFKATDQMEPVDVSALAHLGLPVQKQPSA